MPHKHKVLFIDCVARGGESDTLIDGLRGVIFLIHVEPDSTDLRVSPRLSDGVIMDCAVDTTSTPDRGNIYALYPPENAVAPIAPFICDHELSEELSAPVFLQFRDYEETARRAFEQSNSPAMQAVEIEVEPLCFKRHGCTERHDRRRIFRPAESDDQMVEGWHGA